MSKQLLIKKHSANIKIKQSQIVIYPSKKTGIRLEKKSMTIAELPMRIEFAGGPLNVDIQWKLSPSLAKQGVLLHSTEYNSTRKILTVYLSYIKNPVALALTIAKTDEVLLGTVYETTMLRKITIKNKNITIV